MPQKYEIMKNWLIWAVLGLTFVACKVEQPTANLNYSENLTKYRLHYADTVLQMVEAKQTSDKTIPVADLANSKDISQTAEIWALLEKIAETNKKVKATVGYRVQIYSASDRMEAYSTIEKARKILPDEKIELEYQAPSYKVKIGHYLTRIEAYRTYNLVYETFPEAVILNDKVTIDLEKYYKE